MDHLRKVYNRVRSSMTRIIYLSEPLISQKLLIADIENDAYEVGIICECILSALILPPSEQLPKIFDIVLLIKQDFHVKHRNTCGSFFGNPVR